MELKDYTTLHLLKAIVRVAIPLVIAFVAAVVINNGLKKKAKIKHKKSPCSNKDISKSA